MKTLILAGFACVLLVLSASDQEGLVAPKTATPSIAMVRKADRQKNEVTFVVMSIALQPGKVDADKKKPPEPPTVRRDVQEFTTGLDGFEFVTANGKLLSDKEGWDRLKPGVMLILSSDPRGVDPSFRAVLAPNTLMIVPIGWNEAEGKAKGGKR